MVKVSDMERDIRSIAEKVGTAVFTYDEIHNENVGNKYGYDYQKVIDEVSRLNGRDMTEELFDRGILSMLPDGEYKVNVGKTTENGGGLNYWGMAFFSHSKEDFEVHYHELAHSLQQHYDLFNEDTLDKMYENSSKGLSDEDKDKKLSDRSTYSLYLNEMHSEAFSYCAKLLRAENWLDFTKQALNVYTAGVLSNAAAILDKNKKYEGGHPGAKYYATYPIMKEVIKQAFHIRKQKKLGEYFDENGVINDEKLARLSENVVIRKAYSPRTLKSFFDYNILDGHKNDEHGWKRDTLKTLAIFIPVTVLTQLNEIKKVATVVNHKRMLHKEKQMVNNFLKSPIDKNKSDEEKALEAYQKIKIKLGMVDNQHRDEYIGFRLRQELDNAIIEKGFPKSYINTFGTTYNRSAERASVETIKYINNIIAQMGDNPYFNALVQNNVSDKELQNMLIEKKKDKNKEVVSLDINKKDKFVFKWFPINSMLSCIDNFCTNNGVSKEIKNELFTVMLNDPDKFNDEKYRKNIFKQIKPKKDFLGIKTAKVKKRFSKMMDSISSSYFRIKNDEKIMKNINFLKENANVDMLIPFVKEQLDFEREEAKLARNQGYQAGVLRTVPDNEPMGKSASNVIVEEQNVQESYKEQVIEDVKKEEVVGDAPKKEETVTEQANGAVSEVGSVEKELIDKTTESNSFSSAEKEEVANIVANLNNDNENKVSMSDAFMDKVIANENISEESKNKLLDIAIKTEDMEIMRKEGGKRLYFDESGVERFNKLNLSDEAKKALDIKIEDGKFSIKIPEDENLRNEIVKSVKIQRGLEKLKNGEKENPNKIETNNMSVNMKVFMANKLDR